MSRSNRWLLLPFCALFCNTLLVSHTAHAQTVRKAAKARVAPRSDGRVFRADSLWKHLWVRGGIDEEDFVVEPRAIAYLGENVAVLDQGTREVHILNASSGKTIRTMKATGSGPGEFRQPSQLLARGTLLAVADPGNARVSTFTASGALLWDTPLGGALWMEGGCALAHGQLLVKTEGRSDAMRVLDSAGSVVTTFSLPAIQSDGPPSAFSMSARVTNATTDGRCAVVPIFGNEWYVVDARGRVHTYTFVEASEKAKVSVSEKLLDKTLRTKVVEGTQTTNVSPIVKGAQVVGDTVLIAGAATALNANRLLDYYQLSTGRYLFSRLLPEYFAAVAVGADGSIVGTHIGAEVSMVRALRPTTKRPPTRSRSVARADSVGRGQRSF